MNKLLRINCASRVQVKTINIDATIEMAFDKFCKEKFGKVYWSASPIVVCDMAGRIKRICMEQIKEGRELLYASRHIEDYISNYNDVVVATYVRLLAHSEGVPVSSYFIEENSAILSHTCHLIVSDLLNDMYDQVSNDTLLSVHC